MNSGVGLNAYLWNVESFDFRIDVHPIADHDVDQLENDERAQTDIDEVADNPDTLSEKL